MAHREELIAVTQIGLVGERYWRGVRSVVYTYAVTVHINWHYRLLNEQQQQYSSSQNIRTGTIECAVEGTSTSDYPIRWFMWSDFVLKWSELKWSEVSYGKVLGDKSVVYIRVTLYRGYLIVLWLFHLVCILYCGCFNWFYNVWVSVCADSVMYGCVYVWVL